MKKYVAAVLISASVAGCSRWDLPPLPLDTAYILDGTGPVARIGAAAGVRKERNTRPASMANASMDTTGSIGRSGPFDEDQALAKIMRLKANSSEWLALKKEIEEGRKAENKRELDRITICRC